MWTVYRHPRDYPDKYVARLFEVDARGPRPIGVIEVADKLTHLQDLMLDMGLVKLMRSPEDDPVIVESWL